MELCRELNILLYRAVVITGLGLPNYGSTAGEVMAKVIPLIPDAMNDEAAKYHIIHFPTGEVKDKLFLEFTSRNSQDASEAQVEQGFMKLRVKNCKVESAYQANAATVPVEGKCEMQLIRRLKPFSGSDKPGPGEWNITDWIAAARQLMASQ